MKYLIVFAFAFSLSCKKDAPTIDLTKECGVYQYNLYPNSQAPTITFSKPYKTYRDKNRACYYTDDAGVKIFIDDDFCRNCSK